MSHGFGKMRRSESWTPSTIHLPFRAASIPTDCSFVRNAKCLKVSKHKAQFPEQFWNLSIPHGWTSRCLCGRHWVGRRTPIRIEICDTYLHQQCIYGRRPARCRRYLHGHQKTSGHLLFLDFSIMGSHGGWCTYCTQSQGPPHSWKQKKTTLVARRRPYSQLAGEK